MGGFPPPAPPRRPRLRRLHVGVLAGVAIFFAAFLGLLFAIGAIYVPYVADSASVSHEPSAPWDVVATAGDRSVEVSWKKPHDLGGDKEPTYVVTADPGGGTCTSEAALSCTVTGLRNGVAYTFTVVARNDRGDGPPSDASAPVTPIGLPGAPTAVTGVLGHNAATISWTAPVDDGGSPIEEYVVTGGSAGDPKMHTCSWTSGPLECTITGLTDDLEHTFVVAARNALGVGASSEPSAPLTPTAVASPPSVTAVEPVDARSLRVTFAHDHATDGASPAYEVRCRPVDGGTPVTKPGDDSPIVVDGLMVGTRYGCAVKAQNSKGWSIYLTDSAPMAAGFGLTIGPISGRGAVRVSGSSAPCTATCAVDAVAGAKVVLNAAPATGQAFSGWSGACTGLDAFCVVTMDAAKTVGATFATATAGGSDSAGGDAGAQAAGDAVVTTQSLAVLPLLRGVRWSTADRRGRVTARFRATVGAAYVLSATQAGRTVKGSCRVVGANATCVITLRPRGVWRAAITPSLAGKHAAVVRKLLRV